MSDGSGGAGRRYNRPRRYPVQAPATPDADAAPSDDVTRQNPTFAQAAQQYGRRHTDVPRSPAPPVPVPPADPAPPGYPTAGVPVPPGPGHPRTVSTRTWVLLGAGVLVVVLVVGLVAGLSGNGDPVRVGVPAPSASPSVSTTASPTAAATSPTPVPTPVPSTPPSTPAGGAPPAATERCAALGVTPPVSAFVRAPRPAEALPAGYVQPQSGTTIAVCSGFFRPGAGAGRGTVAYVAEYAPLSATEYALTLKTRGWTLVPDLPRTTYRNLTTTVTLVQQGTALITVVGTGQ